MRLDPYHLGRNIFFCSRRLILNFSLLPRIYGCGTSQKKCREEQNGADLDPLPCPSGISLPFATVEQRFAPVLPPGGELEAMGHTADCVTTTRFEVAWGERRGSEGSPGGGKTAVGGHRRANSYPSGAYNSGRENWRRRKGNASTLPPFSSFSYSFCLLQVALWGIPLPYPHSN